MGKKRSWTDEQLASAVKESKSIRNILLLLGLVPAGGNYVQIQNRIKILKLSTEHFTGKGWNVKGKFRPNPAQPLEKLLVVDSAAQSHLLKKRLFAEGLKSPMCEICGWCARSIDGRVPVELDHINGNHFDNRIENLRILCPNCHSLQTTHRGRNKKVRLRKLTSPTLTLT